jgi:predicted phage terminase large subunit-like protein
MAISNLAILREGVEKELKRRSEAKRHAQAIESDFKEYFKAAWEVVEPITPFIDGWHIDAMCEYLQAVQQDQIRRLVINIPPREGKSLAATVLFPTWCWQRDKATSKWLFFSYSIKLSIRDSINRRQVFQSPWYKSRFGSKVVLSPDSQRQDSFSSTQKGHMMITSLESGTGHGSDYILIDDPLSAAQGMSEADRERAIRFVRQTLFSRFNDKQKGKMVVIMQRLHEADVTGDLLKDGGWTHLKLPAISEGRQKVYFPLSGKEFTREDGDLLDPVRLSKPVLDRLKIEQGPYAFAGQFQQSPSPPEGGILKRQWWRFYVKPEDLGKSDVAVKLEDNVMVLPEGWNALGSKYFDMVAQSWDFTFKDKKDSDFVCGGVIGKKGAQKFLLDVSWDRMDFVATKKAVKALREKWPQSHSIWYEDKANGPAIKSDLDVEISGLIPVEPQGSKEARYYAASPDIAAGNVFLPHPSTCPWVMRFIDECAGAGVGGAHDDAADMIAQAINKMRDFYFGLIDYYKAEDEKRKPIPYQPEITEVKESGEGCPKCQSFAISKRKDAGIMISRCAECAYEWE